MSDSASQPRRLIDVLIAVLSAAIGLLLSLLATPQFGRITPNRAGIGVAAALPAAFLLDQELPVPAETGGAAPPR